MQGVSGYGCGLCPPQLSGSDALPSASASASASLSTLCNHRPVAPSSLFTKVPFGGMLTSSVKGNKLKKALGVLAVQAYGGSQDDNKDSLSPSLPIAPLQLESGVGQFLAQLLQSHPHLVTAAVEQHLEKLIQDRDALKEEQQPSTSGTDLVLHRRIAELKAQERQKCLEEIIYALIVQRFVEGGINMIPKIPSFSNELKVDSWPLQDKELESIHSPEALEMIREHLVLVLGSRDNSDLAEQKIIAQIGKVRVGQVYAASIMYGYFLRRVDKRLQLEKSMKMLGSAGMSDETIDVGGSNGLSETKDEITEEFAAVVAAMARGERKAKMEPNYLKKDGVKPSALRAYVMSFDNETLSRCATLRSKESLNVIEKHAEALFGRPEFQRRPDGSIVVVKDEVLRLSFSGLRRLVLEAVAFGSFLWDVETYVDSRNSFLTR